MKRLFISIALCAVALMPAAAQTTMEGVEVSNITMQRQGSSMAVAMDIDLSLLHVRKNQALVLTPYLVNGADTARLSSIAVYGRRRYYQYLRMLGEGMLTGNEQSFRNGSKPEAVAYSDTAPYEEWMRKADLKLERDLYGCCEELLGEQEALLSKHEPYIPVFRFVAHPEEVKTRVIEGQAYIDFVVNKTDINPTYRNNPTELAKIDASIDTVENDPDSVIDQIWLKGYASPESPYSHNTDLAKGRVKAVKEYVLQLHAFNESKITTEYEPEDWEGLRRYVEESSLEHKAEILALIDRDMDPDKKEAEIKKEYPEEYKFLLDNCYPALRHTDYRVNYTVRAYSTLEEIRAMYSEQPDKLSPYELYILAQSYPEGSADQQEVLLTTVKLYPDNEIANINAANVAMQQDNLSLARTYLNKAGDSEDAQYAREVLDKILEDK